MGVKGLSSFIEGNSLILQEFRLRNNKLVIDGCNLYYLLYFRAGLDQRHGGDYDAFEALIGKFVKALRDCGIEPYVVVDGGFDYSDKKFETLEKRAQDKIKDAHDAAMGLRKSVLPALVKLVFRQALTNLKVPFAKCYGEADRQIASLASEWRCPVLSNDSDFYVFDLPAGFLPISHFRWNAVSQQSGNLSYIPCKRYTTSSFCTYFNIKPQLLPVFAALAGNDYVKLRDLGLSVPWADFAPMGAGRLAHLEGLLHWVRAFQGPLDAMEAALRLMGRMDRQKMAWVLSCLSLGTEEYQLLPSCLRPFFSLGTVPPLQPEAVGEVPDWARLPLTQGRLTSDVLDVLLLRRVSLGMQVDDGSLPSANLTSRPIRQAMYGLLLGGGKKAKVEEYDREGLQRASSMVQATVRGAAQQLKLNSLHKAERSVLLQVYLETLGVSQSALSGVPDHLHLPVTVTCYWFHHASPAPDDSILQALLLGMVSGELRRLNGRGLFGDTSVCILRLDLGVAHALSQWQACMKDSYHLNQLLGLPLPDTHMARLYRGTLVHQLVFDLRRGRTSPEVFLRKKASGRLYRAMLAAVLQSKSQDTKASTSAARRGTASPPQPQDKLTAQLGRLCLQSEEEDEEDEERAGRKTITAHREEDLRCLVSVKTRYKTKDRGQRPHNPELSRKQERRGWD